MTRDKAYVIKRIKEALERCTAAKEGENNDMIRAWWGDVETKLEEALEETIVLN